MQTFNQGLVGWAGSEGRHIVTPGTPSTPQPSGRFELVFCLRRPIFGTFLGRYLALAFRQDTSGAVDSAPSAVPSL